MSDTEKMVLLAVAVLVIWKMNSGQGVPRQTPVGSTGPLPPVPFGGPPAVITDSPHQVANENVDPATGNYYNPLADPCYQGSYVFDAKYCAAQGRQVYTADGPNPNAPYATL